MDWYKGTISAESEEGLEVAVAVLIDHGITGMELINSKERIRDLKSMTSSWDFADERLLFDDGKHNIVFYVPQEEGSHERLERLQNELAQFGAAVEYGNENESKWAHEWKKHFVPIKIRNIVIVPEWDKYLKKEGEIVFTIDPGAAFGTGQHESTRLCIEGICEYIKPGDSVLDIGCGSGILSCISSLLGAGNVLACDIDGVGAINATKRNAKLNGLKNIETFAGDALIGINGEYDLIIANIVADVITALLPLVENTLSNHGRFISSGIISEKADEVKKAMKQHGFKVIWEKELNGWVAFVVEKNA